MDPVYLFFIASFILILYLNKVFMNEKINIVIVILLIFNSIFSALLIFTGNDILVTDASNIYYLIYSLLNIFIFLVIIFSTYSISSKITAVYSLTLKAMKDTKTDLYLHINEFDKVLNISESFLEELGLEQSSVIGNNLFDVIDSSIRIVKMNEEDIDNEYFKDYYRRYKDLDFTQIDDNKKELHIANSNGDLSILVIVEYPIIMRGRYKGRIIVGEKISDSVLLEVEKELMNIKSDAESLRQKFIATLEMIDDSVFYYDVGKGYIWGNDKFKSILNLNGNTIRINDYKKKIFDDDLGTYDETQSNCNVQQKYSISYRFIVGDKYIWIKELSKKIEDGNIILGVIREVQTKINRIESKIPELPDEDDYFNFVNDNIKKGNKIGIIRINLTNIQDINIRNGRKVGDILIKEYVTRIGNGFNFNGLNFYKLGGIDYALVVTDPSQFELITKSLGSASGNRLMNLTIELGGIIETLEPSLGISSGPDDSKTAEGLINAAEKSVSMAKKKSFRDSYCFYKDISDLDKLNLKQKNQMSLNFKDFSDREED